MKFLNSERIAQNFRNGKAHHAGNDIRIARSAQIRFRYWAG